MAPKLWEKYFEKSYKNCKSFSRRRSLVLNIFLNHSNKNIKTYNPANIFFNKTNNLKKVFVRKSQKTYSKCFFCNHLVISSR